MRSPSRALIARLLLATLLTTAVVAAVLWLADADLSDLADGLAAGGWTGLGAMVGLGLLQLGLLAWSWRVLLAGRASLRDCYAAVAVGWAGNLLTPSMYLGGEPVRALFLAARTGLPPRRVMASVLLAKLVEATSFLALLAVSTAIMAARWADRLPAWLLGTVIVCDAALALALGVALLSVIRRWRLLVRVADAVARTGVLRGTLRRHRRAILGVEARLRQALLRRPRALLGATAVMALFHALIWLRPLAFFWVAGRSFGAGELALLFVLIQLLQALQLTPGGLGIVEGGIPAIFLLIAVPVPEALGFAAFLRVVDVVLVGLGLAWLGRAGAGRLLGLSERRDG